MLWYPLPHWVEGYVMNEITKRSVRLLPHLPHVAVTSVKKRDCNFPPLERLSLSKEGNHPEGQQECQNLNQVDAAASGRCRRVWQTGSLMPAGNMQKAGPTCQQKCTCGSETHYSYIYILTYNGWHDIATLLSLIFWKAYTVYYSERNILKFH